MKDERRKLKSVRVRLAKVFREFLLCLKPVFEIFSVSLSALDIYFVCPRPDFLHGRCGSERFLNVPWFDGFATGGGLSCALTCFHSGLASLARSLSLSCLSSFWAACSPSFLRDP